MAAATLDSVILELEARVGEYDRQVANSATTTERAMQRINVAATDTERQLGRNRIGMQGLTYQLNDMTTMFLMGASPMQIFASQGGQLVQVFQQMNSEAKAMNTTLGRATIGGIARFGPYALAAAGGATVLAGVLKQLTDEINENSDVTVTWGDVLLGTMDAAAAAADDVLTSAFEEAGIDIGSVWDRLSAAAASSVNQIIGHFVFANTAILTAWRTFPAAIAEFVINAANGAIDGIESMINRGVAGLNAFVSAINNIPGIDIGLIPEVDLPGIQNTYRGAGEAAGQAMGSAYRNAYRNYTSEAAQRITPFAEARALARLNAEAEEVGRGVGGTMGRAVGRAAGETAAEEFAAAFEEFAKESARIEAEIADKIQQGMERQTRKTEEGDTNLLNKNKALAEEDYQRAQDQITDLADMYQTLFNDGVGGVWRQFKQEGLAAVAMIAARWTIAMATGSGQSLGSIANSVLGQGGLLSSLGGLFGGPRAMGGPVSTGKAYLVGERGPELFMPQGNGTIIPNQALTTPAQAGGGTATVRLVLSGDIDARIDQRSAGVAVQVVRASAGELVDTAAKETVRRLGRRTL